MFIEAGVVEEGLGTQMAHKVADACVLGLVRSQLSARLEDHRAQLALE